MFISEIWLRWVIHGPAHFLWFFSQITLGCANSHRVIRIQEKTGEIWRSCMTNIPKRQICKPKPHKDTSKTFDYTPISDLLATVSWSDNLRFKDQVFRIPAKVVHSKGHTFKHVLITPQIKTEDQLPSLTERSSKFDTQMLVVIKI